MLISSQTCIYWFLLIHAATKWRDTSSGLHVDYDQRPDVFRYGHDVIYIKYLYETLCVLWSLFLHLSFMWCECGFLQFNTSFLDFQGNCALCKCACSSRKNRKPKRWFRISCLHTHFSSKRTFALAGFPGWYFSITNGIFQIPQLYD